MSWLGKIIPGQTHLLSIRSSISDIYAVKMTASYPPPPAPTFLTAKEVDTGKSFSFPPFPKAAPVCQSCRAAVILLCIRGAGASPEGTSGVKAVGFMWIWDQNEYGNRRMGQSRQTSAASLRHAPISLSEILTGALPLLLGKAFSETPIFP